MGNTEVSKTRYGFCPQGTYCLVRETDTKKRNIATMIIAKKVDR